MEFSLRFIRLDDHKLSIFGIFEELLLTLVVLISTFEIRTAQEHLKLKFPKKIRTMRLGHAKIYWFS